MDCPFQAKLVLATPNQKKGDIYSYLQFVEKTLKLEYNHPIIQDRFMSYIRANTASVHENPEANELFKTLEKAKSLFFIRKLH